MNNEEKEEPFESFAMLEGLNRTWVNYNWLYSLLASKQGQAFFTLGKSLWQRISLFVQAAFIADAQRVLVIVLGVSANELFMARLISRSVACDVVVIAREAEAVSMTADEGSHREGAVTTRRTTMNDNEIDCSHDRQQLETSLAALYKKRTDDGGEYGDNKLDDGFPSFQVFE